MNFAILGPGAIGSLWATSLHDAGHQVSLLSRSSQQEIAIALDQQETIRFSNNQMDQLQQSDVLLVTVKAFQVATAMAPLQQHLHQDTIIVLLHNGMGTAERVRRQFPDNPLLLATTTHGAYKPSTQQVKHTGRGQTQIGAFNTRGQQCDFMAEVLNHALPEVIWNPEIERALWNKLAINCAINPLTAIEQCPNGALAGAEYRAKIEAIVKEVAAVMTHEMFNIDERELLKQVTNVIEATAANLSSMNRDIFYQRQSEIDFITGHLIHVAKQHQIEVPYNQSLYQAIKQIEASWTTP